MNVEITYFRMLHVKIFKYISKGLEKNRYMSAEYIYSRLNHYFLNWAVWCETPETEFRSGLTNYISFWDGQVDLREAGLITYNSAVQWGTNLRTKRDCIHWSDSKLLLFWEEVESWSLKTEANGRKTQDVSDKDLIFSVVL